MKKSLKYYLSLNYPITIETDTEDEKVHYILEIPDLQGCGATGESLEEALKKLQDAKELWIEDCLGRRLAVPEPVLEDDFSGKFLLRIPTNLHMTLSNAAKRAKMSLNQYVRSLLEKQISNSDLISEIRTLGKRIGQIEQRMGSVEEAYSTLAEATATVNVATWTTKSMPVGGEILLNQ